MNHPITPLASAEVNHDHLKIELVEPDGMPATVRIVWPNAATVVDPKRFPDVAAAIAQLFARAHVVLAALKAGKSACRSGTIRTPGALNPHQGFCFRSRRDEDH